MEANYAQLSRDTARGEGEYLAAFSTLLGCKVDTQNQVFIRAQGAHVHVQVGRALGPVHQNDGIGPRPDLLHDPGDRIDGAQRVGGVHQAEQLHPLFHLGPDLIDRPEWQGGLRFRSPTPEAD